MHFIEWEVGELINDLVFELSLRVLGEIALGSAIKSYLTPKVFVWIDRICGVIFGGFSVYLLYVTFIVF